MLSKLIFLALGIAVAVVLYMRFGAARIPGSDARLLVSKGALLLDVRSPEEFASGHIEGAINIPVRELGGRVDELGSKAGDVVVYCQSGVRSAAAKRMLESRGFANVHDMGGISQW